MLIGEIFNQFNQAGLTPPLPNPLLHQKRGGEGMVLLTPNQRLAATLLKKYSLEQIQAGKTCWPTPSFLPLNAWIASLWDQYCAQEMEGRFQVLTADQELVLWEEILRQTPESEQLLKLSELAQQAKAAWSTLRKWRTGYDSAAFALNDNSRAFQTWAKQFEERCAQEGWVDGASLPELVLDKIVEGKINLPSKLLLLNFTEFTPQQEALLQACESKGVPIKLEELAAPQCHEPHHQEPYSHGPSCHASSIHDSSISYIGLPDAETEIQSMARWAKAIREKEPEASIGCIASELEEKREALLAVFSELFPDRSHYNISAGKTLASYPVLAQAFNLLHLPLQNVNFETLATLLRSTFIGDAEKEKLKRLAFDAVLRRKNIYASSWEKLLKSSGNLSLTETCPLLAERLTAYFKERDKEKAPQPISQWMRHFSESLELLGWPGEQSLNSAEYQVVTSWMNLLQQTALLDQVLPDINHHQALHYLTVLAAKAYFQPESPDAPIQILGQLEGAGLPFDYLWVSGLDDRAWPPVPSPNPLLPYDLQKRLQMPNASADRQLSYSLKLTEQYKQSAPTVIFSYAERSEKETLLPSPLISAFNKLRIEELRLAPLSSALQRVYAARELETFEDEKAPPLLSQGKLEGGSAVFQHQAACPFKAFAKVRLKAEPLEAVESGLPARIRGKILHRCLELFWEERKDQQGLLALDKEDLKEKLKAYLKLSLQEEALFLQPESVYYQLILERLGKILLDWLELEKTRPPFRVLAQEEERLVAMNNLQIKWRVDRIDELADGGQLIIDYKTRKTCDTREWFGQRPTEPQLPLYCLSNPGPTVGLAFAQLHCGAIGFHGLSQKSLDLSGIKPLNEKTEGSAGSWEAQLEAWRLDLRQLLENFQNGQAEVAPKNAESCQRCDLQSLCRVHELENLSEAS